MPQAFPQLITLMSSTEFIKKVSNIIRKMITNNVQTLAMIGETITESASHPRTAGIIRQLHSTNEGAEILRLIVRDNLGGAADVIANALWDNL